MVNKYYGFLSITMTQIPYRKCCQNIRTVKLGEIAMSDNKSIFSRFVEGLNEFYHAPYRQTLARAARDEEALFMLLLFSESLGIDNPASFYTLELQPIFLEKFHEWHQRMGMPRCPLQHGGCC